jgi:uncharacterized protein (DUF488 family)
MTEILSIGHSTLDYPSFALRLKAEGVTAVADVRTAPYSRHQPHFSRNELKSALARDSITYVFLGKELGGRPDRLDVYTDGVADYEKMARTSDFMSGLERLEKGARIYRVAMMCSERNPLDCHRCLLVARALKEQGHYVRHLLPEGRTLDQGQIEEQLLAMADRVEEDMFASQQDRLAEAYRLRARKVAFVENELDRQFAAE